MTRLSRTGPSRFLEIYRQTSPSERVMCARTFSNRCCWVHVVAVLQYLPARNGGPPIFTAWRDPSHGPRRRHFHDDFPQQGSSFFARTIRDLDSQKSSRRATISRRVARASCERQRCGITGGVHMPARPPDPFHGEQTAAASGGPPSSNRWPRCVAPERDCPVFWHWRLPRTSQLVCLVWLSQTDRIVYSHRYRRNGQNGWLWYRFDYRRKPKYLIFW